MTTTKTADLTVVIPTTDRPNYLRTALQSVAAQTAVARIGHVIVSQNASGVETRAVAESFAERLPIRFVQRSTPGPGLQHFAQLMRELPDDGLVAMLHDDDWWQEDHLARAMYALETTEAIAHFSGHYFVSAESSPVTAEWSFRMWFGAEFPHIARNWPLSFSQMLFACLIGTPAHYSGTIAAPKIWRQAGSEMLRHENPYDNDRIFALEVAKLGPVSYSPLPTVFARLHATQDFRVQYRQGGYQARVHATTNYVIACAESTGIDVRAGLASRLDQCPAAQRSQLVDSFRLPEIADAIRAADAMPSELQAQLEEPRSSARTFLRSCIPPILVQLSKTWSARGGDQASSR